MPGYLDSLPPDTTMRAVFEGVHGRVHDIADWFGDFDQAEGMSPGEARREPLARSVFVETVAGSGSDGQPHRRATIYAEIGGVPTRLLAISGMHDAAHLPPDTFPSGVEGFWGAPFEERLGGAYRLSRRSLRHDPVEARLGKLEVALPNDPFTTVSTAPTEKLKYLRDKARQHLSLVTQRVIDGVDALELILDGTPAQEALEMIGRPL
jgi:hypothetical protein